MLTLCFGPQGLRLDADDQETLTDQFSRVSDEVLLTQQFLVLQNIRVDDQMPGGANCSYADSWFTGALWEKSDDEFQWTRSAWLQCQRAKNWQEMPSVWKRIMRNAWEDFQDFLAMLALPDGGKFTARFAEHERAWEQVRAAYMSNINRRAEQLAEGELQAEVDASKAAAQPYIEAKTREPQVQTIFEWLGYKGEHLVRQVTDTETHDDEMKKYQSIEVQLFGIPLFNTKDPVSERLWSMGASQGETVTGWPLKAAAWIAKKMERVGTMSLPPEPPTTSDTHVLLENTRYHDKYRKGDVDKRRSNALERIHSYVTSNFEARNSSAWNSIKEDFDEDVAESAQEAQFPIMKARSYVALAAELRERLDLIAAQVDDKAGSYDAALADMLSELSLRDTRKAVEAVFDNHGGGELRMTAISLNVRNDPCLDSCRAGVPLLREVRHGELSQRVAGRGSRVEGVK